MLDDSVFKKLKIIDLSTVLAGPSVGSFFAELGAQVIKIENPNQPDVTRSWKLPSEDKDSSISAYFSSVNYKKEYLSLNLKETSDREKLFHLLEDADVLLMNFKLGDQEKLHIPDERLHEINPSLIIGKINGFGADDDRVAYDLILQAETGIMTMNGTPESGPVKMPVAFIDVLAAHHLKQGILIELINRSTQSAYQGKTVSVSLYDAAVSSLINQASNYLMANHIPERIGSLHPNIAPYGELFTTLDQKTITFAIGSNTHFKKLCSFLNADDLATNPLFSRGQNRVKHRQELFEILQRKIQKFTRNEILDYMHANRVPCGEVKDLKRVFESQKAQNLIREEIIDEKLTKRVTSIAFQTKESNIMANKEK